MIKSIIKEIFIMLLLILAVILVLGIYYYDERPSEKKIPTAVEEYSLPQEMQEELDETLEEQEVQSIIKTYSINADDLKHYERTNDYKKGKPNPFALYKTQSTESSNSSDGNISSGSDSSGNTSNSNSSETGNNETPQNTSQGRFLNEVK